MFTPKAIHLLNPGQVLVSGEDENGLAVNAPIVTDPELVTQLRETPPTIPNPAYQPLLEQAFAKAEALLAEQAELMK